MGKTFRRNSDNNHSNKRRVNGSGRRAEIDSQRNRSPRDFDERERDDYEFDSDCGAELDSGF